MSEQSMAEAPAEQHASVPASQGDGDEQGSGRQDDGGGQGQSKSSRRRRRKRKGRMGGAAGSEGGDSQAQEGSSPEPGTLPAVEGEAAARPQGSRESQAQGGASLPAGQGQPGNTKRWKKKFRERNGRGDGQQGGQQAGFQGGGQSGGQSASHSGGGFRGPDTHQPGNNAMGGKRKGFKSGGGQGSGGHRQRSGFVGPMDHSYRAPNGNVFDAAASTTDQGHARGRHSGDAQPIDYSQGRAVPIAPGTPTRIYFFIEDLFFTAKISETARKLGVKIAFIKNEKEQLAEMLSGDEATRPALIVFDLNNANSKPMTLIPKLRTKLKKTASIVGFLSTLQGELRAKAVEAGCDTVMPRAAFSQNLPNLLRRYGLEEADDTQNFNQ